MNADENPRQVTKNQDFRIPENPSTENLKARENAIFPMPMQQNTETSASEMDYESTEAIDIFEGLKFVIVGFAGAEYAELKRDIDLLSGCVVSKTYRGIADYAVVPVFGSELHQTTSEVVNDLWIRECCREKEIRDVLYYHRPIAIQNTTVLAGCAVTLSSYAGYERNFLQILVTELGGIAQDKFARISVAKDNIFASTHLIASEPSGKKYCAAIKWKLPVVDKNWLLECARTGKLVPEDDYLIGDAVGKMLIRLFLTHMVGCTNTN